MHTAKKAKIQGGHMENVSIKKAALMAVDEMLALGYKPRSAWEEYETCYARFIRYHEQNGKAAYDASVMMKYLEELRKSYKSEDISYNTYRRYVHGAESLAEFCKTGRLPKKKNQEKSWIYGNLRQAIDGFSDWNIECGETTRKLDSGIAGRFLVWLQNNEHKDFSKVTGETAWQYLTECAERYAPVTLLNVKSGVKKFYKYLHDVGFIESDYEKTFDFPILLPNTIKIGASQDDIAIILAQVDRFSPKGKRDYAILLLGAVTGLRACDIINIKLDDIDWKNGEIRIIQQKTHKSLTLPLTKDVGVAVQEYILNARVTPFVPILPDERHVFLRLGSLCNTPLGKGGVNTIYKYYQLKAGLQSGSFHDLRRGLGSRLVVGGATLATTSQTLGHVDPDVAKKYMAFNTSQMQACALDFSGIEPLKGSVL